MFVIKQERKDGAGEPVSMWLRSSVPMRWGERERALRFVTKGEARRVAVSVRLPGVWFVEPV